MRPRINFTLEELVALHPDSLFAGWNYGLQTGTNLTPASLAKYGIKTLALTESCAYVQPGTSSVSINDTYTDLRNLGAIFGVQARARQKEKFLQTFPATKNLPAVKNKCFLPLAYDEVTQGPRNAE